MDNLKKLHKRFLLLSIVLSVITVLTFLNTQTQNDSELFRLYALLFALILTISITIVLKVVKTTIQEEISTLLIRIIELEKGNELNGRFNSE